MTGSSTIFTALDFGTFGGVMGDHLGGGLGVLRGDKKVVGRPPKGGA
jgi:hypothetical protein